MKDALFDYRFEVTLQEADAAGRMFFDHLFHHAHAAYEAFMRSHGAPLEALLAQGIRIPLVHAEAVCHRPIAHGQLVRVTLYLQRLGGTSFTLCHRFLDQDGVLLAEAKTTHVHLAATTEAATPLPPRLQRLFTVG